MLMTNQHRHCRIVSVLVVGLLIVSTAQAQSPRGQRGRFSSRGIPSGSVFLASVDEVQQELKLDSVQRDLVSRLQIDLRDQVNSLLFSRGRNRGGPGPGQRPGPQRPEGNSSDPGSAENRNRDRQVRDAQSRMREIQLRSEELIRLVLAEQQLQRLEQLRLQFEGLRSLGRDEVLQQFALSEEQSSKVTAIINPPAGSSGGRLSTAQVNSQVLALLSDEQREKWTQMQGEKFDFPEWIRRLGRSRSPNRRGPPNNGGNRQRGGRPDRPQRPPSDNDQ